MAAHFLLYAGAFLCIWLGSGLAIKAVERISRSLRISSFVVSFIVLGLFTSVSEFSVGINSIAAGDAEIFVGNLIGASIVLFLLAIPLLAIVGKSIRVTPDLQGVNLPMSLAVIAAPVLLSIDGQINFVDSIISISLYAILVGSLQTRKQFDRDIKNLKKQSKIKLGRELGEILLGIVIIFVASKVVVEQTEYFSRLLGISPFLISLLVIAIGTNIPELSLVVRSAFIRNHQVAFGDYVGSASFNTFLVGLLTLINGSPVLLNNSYMVSLLFLIVGLFAFHAFARSKHTISRAEAVVLLLIYVVFIATEAFIHKNIFTGL